MELRDNMADIVERLDTATIRFASENQAEATVRRNEAIADAKTEITTLRAEVAALREGLADFACLGFESAIVDESGWTEFGISWRRDRIVDWFGPSAFRNARALLAKDSGL